jgi:hypothetical protein
MSEYAGALESDTGELVAPLVDEADLILPQEDVDYGSALPPAPGSPPREPYDALGPHLPPDVPLPPLSNFPAAFVNHGNEPATGLPERSIPPSLRTTRPFLRRDGSVPAPRQPPPPPILAGFASSAAATTVEPAVSPTSLLRARKIAYELPRLDPTPYAFTYRDAASFPEELEEWFSYTIEERGRISAAQLAYGIQRMEWNKASGDDASSWLQASEGQRQMFMRFLKDGVAQRASEVHKANDGVSKDETVSDVAVQKLEAVTYLVLGAFSESAGISTDSGPSKTDQAEKLPEEASHVDPPAANHYNDAQLQLVWIRKNTLLFLEDGGAKVVMDIFRASADREFLFETMQLDNNSVQRQLQQREAWCAQTLLYICLEVIRSCDDTALRLPLRADLCK